jgi:hypothetical protein
MPHWRLQVGHHQAPPAEGAGKKGKGKQKVEWQVGQDRTLIVREKELKFGYFGKGQARQHEAAVEGEDVGSSFSLRLAEIAETATEAA